MLKLTVYFFPKGEAFSSKEKLASGKAIQHYLPNCSNAVVQQLKNPLPGILQVFSMTRNQDIATVHFDCFLHFSLL